MRLRESARLGLLLLAATGLGCANRQANPELASSTYPAELHRAVSIDVQVFREDTEMELVNATANSYEDVVIWLNQRFAKRVEAIPAGKRVRLSLWGFRDERGEPFNAGGFWRTRRATPLWLVEMQLADDVPMTGLVTVLPDLD